MPTNSNPSDPSLAPDAIGAHSCASPNLSCSPARARAARAARAASRADALDAAASILRQRAGSHEAEARRLRAEHGLICAVCGGMGRSYGMSHDYPCDACDGSGKAAGDWVDSGSSEA